MWLEILFLVLFSQSSALLNFCAFLIEKIHSFTTWIDEKI